MRRDRDRPELAAPTDVVSGGLGGVMLIIIGCDEKSFLSQQLDISLVAPTLMRYWQASYTASVAVFGVLCGSA